MEPISKVVLLGAIVASFSCGSSSEPPRGSGTDAYVKLASNSLDDTATVNVDAFQAHVVGDDTITVTGSRDGSRFCASGSPSTVGRDREGPDDRPAP